MNRTIPLHSLVFCPSLSHLDEFPSHERLTKQLVQHDLVGEDSHLTLGPIVVEELRHRIALKLSLGERVVVYSGDMAATEREQLTRVAHQQGASIVEIDADNPATFARPLLIDRLRLNWRGITVIGDVHGDHTPLLEAMAWARSRQHFVWLLGDIVDYGSHTLDCLTTVYHAVMRGEAATVLGNHERKIARWLDQKDNGKARVRTTDGNRVTLDALDQLGATERRRWIGQFRSLLAHTSLLCQMNTVTLLHAAAHPSLWSDTPDDASIEHYALYGEPDHSGDEFQCSYRWVDHVPRGQTVYVGHDQLHEYPMVRTGARGGEVVFLDTGAGKGGHLASADLRFTCAGLHLECFKRY